MPKPRVAEKPHNFFASMKRLLINLKPWKLLMTSAIILALVSSIFSIITPNKLSDFADEIGKGLIPNTEALSDISKKMMENIDKDKIRLIATSSSIPKEDYDKFINGISNLENMTDEEKKEFFLNIPESILYCLLDDITYEGKTITVDDQVEMIRVMKTESDFTMLDKLPESIKNIVYPTLNISKIKNIATIMAILYMLSALFSFIQNFEMTTVSNRFAFKLRDSISKKINKLPLKYFDNHKTGDILSRVTNDVDTIAQNLNNSLGSLVSNITLFLGSIIMMFITNYIMALTAIISSILGFALTFKILGKSQKYFANSQKSLGDLNGYIEEIYTGHNIVKVYNAKESSIEKFEQLNNNLYEAKRKSIFLSGTMQPIMGFIGNFGYVCVCIVGALLASKSVISFGVIVAFMIYVRLFTNPMSQIAQNLTSLQSVAASSERVYEFLDEVEMTNENNFTKKLDKNNVKGKIEFKNVKFGYNDDKLIIKNFSANVKPGEKVAIVGPTGAGKTTMVNLLMKFYEINDGDILIDDVSIKELTRENIHDLFCMVLQDTWLFDGSIKENIKFNKDNITDEEIINSCKVVGIEHFIKTLPGGINSNVNNSDSISSGQKQLFTIARGMIEDAPFLILDEATSNVDTRTEELVQKAMDKLTKGKTSFIIAHRLSTIKNADLILVMKDGNIIETGTHDELIEKNGFYADLYNSQFKNS